MQKPTLSMESNSSNFNTVLVTGSAGQLGNEIRLASSKLTNSKFIFTDIAELDITNQQSVKLFFSTKKPDIIVNCAAYTAVDKAEEEVEKANLLNSVAPQILAQEAKVIGAKLIHVSTDYVFDGKTYVPYNEETETSPNSIYGKSKLEGEKAVIDSKIGMVIRTSWL